MLSAATTADYTKQALLAALTTCLNISPSELTTFLGHQLPVSNLLLMKRGQPQTQQQVLMAAPSRPEASGLHQPVLPHPPCGVFVDPNLGGSGFAIPEGYVAFEGVLCCSECRLYVRRLDDFHVKRCRLFSRPRQSQGGLREGSLA
jgi:hypothetical protein